MPPTADPNPAAEPFRVQELSDRAGVSVDTIRFYQKRQLLAPPTRAGRVAWYGAAHLERLHQIKELQAEGFTLTIIRRVLDGELGAVDRPLAAAVAESDTEEFLTVDELATRAGIPVAVIEAVVAEGLLLPRVHDGTAHFTTADVEVATAGLELLEAGVPLEALLELARRHHTATIEIAAAAVEMFDEHVRRPLLDADLDDDERAARLVGAFRTLLPATGTLVAQHFRRVLLRVAQEHLEAVGGDDERAAAEAAGTRRIEEARP
ncbi:MAG: MerR family transcriptional regulator [Acidimicrobiia bacterium]|nr:MerR family transcriptional regulator [Acidimicrobiia bacterium]